MEIWFPVKPASQRSLIDQQTIRLSGILVGRTGISWLNWRKAASFMPTCVAFGFWFKLDCLFLQSRDSVVAAIEWKERSRAPIATKRITAASLAGWFHPSAHLTPLLSSTTTSPSLERRQASACISLSLPRGPLSPVVAKQNSRLLDSRTGALSLLR